MDGGFFVRIVGGAVMIGLFASATGCQDVHARKLVKEGNDLYKEGEYKQAVARYNEAERLKPDLAVLHINRAYAYLQQFSAGSNSPDSNAAANGALESYKKFLELEPGRNDVRDLMIQLWLDSGHYDEALNYFKGVLQKNPKNLEAVKTLGVINSKAGRFQEALNWYEKRTQLEPDNPEGHYAVGTLCWDQLHNHADIIGPQRLALADHGIHALEKAIKLNDKYQEAYTYTNLLYRERALGHGDTQDPVTGAQAAAAAQEDVKKAEENMKKALELLRGAQAQAQAKKQ
jgi:tetratricopeptide (TPR) repeat protein